MTAAEPSCFDAPVRAFDVPTIHRTIEKDFCARFPFLGLRFRDVPLVRELTATRVGSSSCNALRHDEPERSLPSEAVGDTRQGREPRPAVSSARDRGTSGGRRQPGRWGRADCALVSGAGTVAAGVRVMTPLAAAPPVRPMHPELGVTSCRCRYCGALIVHAPRVGDHEIHELRRHLRCCRRARADDFYGAMSMVRRHFHVDTGTA